MSMEYIRKHYGVHAKRGGKVRFAPYGNRYLEGKGMTMKWQPIETAPKDGRTKILLKTPYSPNGCEAYSNTWWTVGFSAECKPTHWMPLPSPPSRDE